MAVLLGALGAGSGLMSGLSTIATIAGPVLSIAGAVSRVQEGRSQQAEFNRQAKEERVTSSIRAARMRRDGRIRQSRERLMMLEGGAGSGTAFDVLRQNAAADEADAMMAIFSGEQAARGSEARGRASKVSPLTIFSTAIDSFSQVDPLNIGGQV